MSYPYTICNMLILSSCYQRYKLKITRMINIGLCRPLLSSGLRYLLFDSRGCARVAGLPLPILYRPCGTPNSADFRLR